ncbi:MAG: VWA domain-containing protein [Cytophagales bacterium]|nr:VWA domain-containing protein [Cytophagales bacterium]
MVSFQRWPNIFELILIGSIVFFYFIYIVRVSYLAIVLKTGFRSVFIKLFFRSIYLILIVISLMSPTFGDIKKEIKSIGKDIYVLIDLSNSMNARDVQPSRLEKVKFELKKIADAFASDRIGLIIFSSDAFVQCPLTYDMGAISLFIETLNSKLVPEAGTDFAPALQLVMKRFEKSDTKGQIEQKSKIVILFSDGEDFGEETQSLANELEDKGIKLFTVGIGTQDGAQIPTEYGFKTDQNGKTVISKLNIDALKRLADITSGKYYEISNIKNEIPKLIKDISGIEGELREVKTIDATANKYFYFLFIALGFIILDVLITIKTIKI